MPSSNSAVEIGRFSLAANASNVRSISALLECRYRPGCASSNAWRNSWKSSRAWPGSKDARAIRAPDVVEGCRGAWARAAEGAIMSATAIRYFGISISSQTVDNEVVVVAARKPFQNPRPKPLANWVRPAILQCHTVPAQAYGLQKSANAACSPFFLLKSTAPGEHLARILNFPSSSRFFAASDMILR